jgi:hypothetical protein
MGKKRSLDEPFARLRAETSGTLKPVQLDTGAVSFMITSKRKERPTLARTARMGHLKSYSIRGRLDAFVAEVDFGLAAMMGYVDVHGKQDFAARQVSVGRVVGGRELLLR